MTCGYAGLTISFTVAVFTHCIVYIRKKYIQHEFVDLRDAISNCIKFVMQLTQWYVMYCEGEKVPVHFLNILLVSYIILGDDIFNQKGSQF